MTFLTPWSALVAALVAIPLLLLLYFLKLRRRMLRIPSTMLWRRTHEDLQVNVPFQRLRVSALLVLQLLLLVALLLALAQPQTTTDADPAARMVLLIDRSASMRAVDAPDGPSRLDAARTAAREIIDQLDKAGRAGAVMVTSFAASVRVECGFGSSVRELRAALDAIEPTDAPGRLEQALQLAEAFSRRSDEAETRPVEVVLLSDGGVEPAEDARGFSLAAGTFRFVRVGPEPDAPVDNVGIVAFSGRRDFDDPQTVLIFARLANAAPTPVDLVLTLARDEGETEAIRTLTVPAATAESTGRSSTTFSIAVPGGAVLTLAHNHADHLAADDTAALVLPPPDEAHVLLVHGPDEPDRFLHDLLDEMELERLDLVTADRYASMDQVAIDAGTRYDLLVFDRVGGHRLPGIPSLTIGAPPAGVDVVGDPPETGQRFLSWERTHATMRHVSLDAIVFAGVGALRLPAGATPLAHGAAGPVIGALRVRGEPHLLVGFPLERSNWPMDVSFTVFMHNALEFLSSTRSGHAGLGLQPGDTYTFRVEPGVDRARLTGPENAEIPVLAGRPNPGPVVERVGLYRLDGAVPPMDRVAVSLVNDRETDTRGRSRLVVNAEALEATTARRQAPRPWWPWLVAAAGALALIEWLVYCLRMSR